MSIQIKFFLLYSFLFPLLLYAQSDQSPFSFTHISQSVSTEEKNILALFQDSRGFIWMGTHKGLCRYDGKNFKYYDRIGKNGITNWAVNCITEDVHGNIWFGTENGLNKLNPFTEIIDHYYADKGISKIPYNWCNELFTDNKKQLWLSTESGLAYYNETRNSFVNFPVKLYDTDERKNKFINNIIEDLDGNLWLGTSFGIKKFNTDDHIFLSYVKNGTENIRKENVIYSLCIDHNNTIWAGTFSGMLLKFNKMKDLFEKEETIQLINEQSTIFDIKEIKSGNDYLLLFATAKGLYYTNNNSTISKLKYSNQPTAKGLRKILVDRQKNIWVAGEEGLFKINKNGFAFKWMPLPDNKTNNPIYHIITSVEDSSIFHITTKNGWWKYDANNQTIETEKIPYSKERLLEYINNWQADENGYFFTSVNGLGYYNSKQNKLIDLSKLVFHYSQNGTTGFIEKVASDKYWITMKRSGILEYNSVTGFHRQLFANKDDPDNVYALDIQSMKKLPNGLVYFIAGKKLYEVNPIDYQYKIYTTSFWGDENIDVSNTNPSFLCITNDNKILLNNDLKIFRLENQKLNPIYPGNGFSSEQIGKIFPAKDGFWILSEQEVFKTDTNLQHWQNLKQILGWPDTTIIYDIHTNVKGKTLFASQQALGILDNNALLQSEKPEKIIAGYIKFGKNQQYFPSEKITIEASYKDGIEIELCPVDFNDENKILYKLQAWDDEWKELINTSVIRYDQLPPGEYSLVAKAVNPLGLESKEMLLKMQIIPPFYRTWWFMLMNILVVSIFIYGLYQYNLHKALELQKLRIRISTDLHDDVGATLSSISLYSESLKVQVKEKLPHLESILNKIGENSREMLAQMSDIVWTINPDNDSGHKMVLRMENYATDMCAVKSIVFNFTANEKIKHINIPLEIRRNVYLIFKEVVNNAVKYSGAKNIFVNIQLASKKIVLIIKDDGIGFNEMTVNKGNGINNMYLRAKKIEGELIIQSHPSNGTEIQLIAEI